MIKRHLRHGCHSLNTLFNILNACQPLLMVTSRPKRGRHTMSSTVFQRQCLKLHLGCTHFGVYRQGIRECVHERWWPPESKRIQHLTARGLMYRCAGCPERVVACRLSKMVNSALTSERQTSPATRSSNNLPCDRRIGLIVAY